MTSEQPVSIGRIVHYTSYGTPGGEYGRECRAAVVTEVGDDDTVGLCVLNPTGTFFNRRVRYDPGEGRPGDPECPNRPHDGPHRYCPCGWAEPAPAGGTWHWPERAGGPAPAARPAP